MPNWSVIRQEIANSDHARPYDQVRHRYIKKLKEYTGRPTIVYYSGWLQQTEFRGHPHAAIDDLDMEAFMANVHGIDHDAGLDLVLHTPGGEIEATRAIVEYLRQIFGNNIRVAVPHLALSAGTMIACASDRIVLGKHSSLGPTDPQVRGFPALGIIGEVDRALNDIEDDPRKKFFWQCVFEKYPPGFITDCERAKNVTQEILRKWLTNGMLRGSEDPEDKVNSILSNLMHFEGTTSHGHHFMLKECQEFGLKVEVLENDQKLQENVLSVHHAFVASLLHYGHIKLVENHADQSWSVEPDR